MREVLLISEGAVKERTSISDNIAGKYIHSAILDAQENGLRHIIGQALLEKCKALVENGTIGQPANARYKALLDVCQQYLAYATTIELTYRVTYKIDNFGVVKSNDENMAVAGADEIVSLRGYYQAKVDAACLDIQHFILEDVSRYPELTDNDCRRIKACLHSAASCGIFLGGARGRWRR